MPPPRVSPSSIVRTRLAAAILCALAVAGCSSGRENLDQPPNARGIVIANRTLLWRNLDSIRNASIAPPQRQGDVWRVCVRMTIKGPLGTKPGERDYLVGLYGVAKPPELLPEDAAKICAGQPHVPFPEMEGGYQADEIKPGGKRRN
jgi:hypothetical protein